MTRSKQCRSTALCACLTALALFAPASANAAQPSAVEEYTLRLPGVDSKEIGDNTLTAEETKPREPLGVVGEQADTFTRLGAVGSAAGTPAGLAVIALVVVGAALTTRRHRSDS